MANVQIISGPSTEKCIMLECESVRRDNMTPLCDEHSLRFNPQGPWSEQRPYYVARLEYERGRNPRMAEFIGKFITSGDDLEALHG